MTVTPDMVIAEAKKYLGWPYGYRDRCGGSYHELDCSGLICKVMNTLGLNIGCITSFVFAQLAWDHGLVAPKERALEVGGMFLIEGPNQGRGPSQRRNGADGHIILCDRTYSVEERGHAYGCVIVPVNASRLWQFQIASYIPGVDYRAPVPPKPKPPVEVDDVQFIQQPYLPADADGNIPGALFLPPSATWPHGTVKLLWGANVTGSTDWKDGHGNPVPNTRLWDRAPVSDHKWVGMFERASRAGIAVIDDHDQTTKTTQGDWVYPPGFVIPAT